MINVSLDWERSQMLITVVTFAGTPRQNWEISGGFGMHLFLNNESKLFRRKPYRVVKWVLKRPTCLTGKIDWRNKGRGVTLSLRTSGQGHKTPIPTPHAHTHTVSHNCCIMNARFHTFWLYHHGPTDRQTDGPMDQRINGRTKPPQLKTAIRH